MNLNRTLGAGALGLSILFSGLSSINEAAAVTEAQPGTAQYDLLQPSINWIKKISGCCNWAEGRGDFEEITETRYRDDGTPYTHYKIILDPEAYGMPGEPVEIDIPDDKVLKQSAIDAATESCETLGQENCERPWFNVAWMVVDDYDGGNTGKGWHIYCYLPKSMGAELELDSNRDFAALETAAPSLTR